MTGLNRSLDQFPSLRWLPLVVWILVIAGGISACGPVRSTTRIHDAEAAVERARVADAHQKAPYEYYSSVNYLYKAKEEWGYSDFEAAYDYAAQAKRNADAALLKAKEDPWEGPPTERLQKSGGETPTPDL